MASQRKSKSITATVVSLIPGHGKPKEIKVYHHNSCESDSWSWQAKGNQSLSLQQLWVWFLVMAGNTWYNLIWIKFVYDLQQASGFLWLLWLMSLWFSCLATHNTSHSSPILNPASTVFQTLDFPFAKQASVVFQNCFTLEIFGGNTK